MTTKKARYKTLTNYPGIKKELDKISPSYIVIKSIDGKRYFTTFDKLEHAVYWKQTYHPLICPDPLKNFKGELFVPTLAPNGADKGHTFLDAWNLYKELHLADKTLATREVFEQTINRFFAGLMPIEMINVTPELLDHYIKEKKQVALLENNPRRHCFKEELKRFKTILNWYHDNYDYTFRNPVLPRHFVAGKIKDKKDKIMKMSPEQIFLFFNALEEGLWRDLAMTQFYICGRIQEAAGLTIDAIDLVERVAEIKKVMVWSRKDRQYAELKNVPKNGLARYVSITDTLFEIFSRRIAELPGGCSFIFHEEGRPLSYRTIQYQYNKALKKAGLYPEFTCTHILRHSMATITRKVTRSLDATQAVTGHRDQRLAEHYATVPLEAQVKAVNDVELYMNSIKANQTLSKKPKRTLHLIKN